jgi:hypothetical protein
MHTSSVPGHARTRAAMALALALTVLGNMTAGAAETQNLEFDVSIDGKPVGTHRFEVSSDTDGSRQIVSNARFDYRMLGLSLFRYNHRATEQWQDGCLTHIESDTDNNGKQVRVRGARREGRLVIAEPSGLSRDGCVRSFAYWDRNALLDQVELLNPQTGKFESVRVEALGPAPVVVRGASVTAERYRISGDKLDIQLWYSPQGEWLQLSSIVKSNRDLRYVRRD